jgi:hypothetical protein
MNKPIASKKVVSDLWGMLQMSIDEAVLAEREACAELRNKFHPFDGQGRQEIIDVMNTALDDYQAAIRARGEKA